MNVHPIRLVLGYGINCRRIYKSRRMYIFKKNNVARLYKCYNEKYVWYCYYCVYLICSFDIPEIPFQN